METQQKRIKLCGNKCVVCGKSKFSNPGLKLFIFPRKDANRCEKWVESTGYHEFKYLPLEAKRYVCELHFEEKDFMSVLKNRLMPNAVPKKGDAPQNFTTNKPTSYYRSPMKRNLASTKENQPASSDMLISTNNELKLPYSINVEQNSTWNIVNSHINSLDISEKNNCDNLTSFLVNDILPSEASEQTQNKINEEFVPMIQPFYKRNGRPVPCRHCKRKDKTILALRKRLRELKRLTFKNRIDQLKHISEDSKTFAKMILTHGSHRVWTEEEKTFAIDLLNKSSSTYYYLRHNKKLILPSKASIHSWIKERSKKPEQNGVNVENNIRQNESANEQITMQQNNQLPEGSMIPTIDTIIPLTCALEIPMSHPNDNILSIPDVNNINTFAHQMQTITTLEPIQTNLHGLSHTNNINQPIIQSEDNPYKQTYQIITPEGIKSTYIIHLNKS